MMLALLYHRVGDGKYANSPSMMSQHLTWVAERYRTVLPGDDLNPFGVDICLTFDDATYDFYHYVFPLLKQLNIRALLSVPVHFIQDRTELDPSLRLSVPYSVAMKGDIPRTHVPFCTWQELREMAHSQVVQIASHSIHHRNMIDPGLDLDWEIAGSKRILESQLLFPIRTFVYPLGKFNRAVHKQVKSHYEFAMRIGTAWNSSWQNWSGMVYRIISDNLAACDYPLRASRKLSYSWFYLINSLRGR
jgi:peptidoglycan/xylan/chitin deacetylase (PgdA/CDA1 family)